MKIYTRRGDGGETDLFGGDRVTKDHLRVEAYGAVDELNAALGVAASHLSDPASRARIEVVQEALFDLGAYLAAPSLERREKASIAEPTLEGVEALEAEIDRLESELKPLKRFVLPGGTPSAAALHLARTICRRAERRSVALHREQALAPAALRYLNRLSDWLFVLARFENHRAGVADVEWVGRR